MMEVSPIKRPIMLLMNSGSDMGVFVAALSMAEERHNIAGVETGEIKEALHRFRKQVSEALIKQLGGILGDVPAVEFDPVAMGM